MFLYKEKAFSHARYPIAYAQCRNLQSGTIILVTSPIVTTQTLIASNLMMQKDNDFIYIERILAGNKSDFSYLVDKYKDMVFTIAFRITCNREDAEEVAQDVFLKAYKGMDKFKKTAGFSTWLYRIAYNHSISKIRKKKPDIQSVDDPDYNYKEIAQDDPEMEKMNRIPVEYLKRAMEKLDETDRIILTLFYQDDCPVKEIAIITGLSPSNVKVKMHRSRKKMMDELKLYLKKELIDQL